MKRIIAIILSACTLCGCILDKTESPSDIKVGDSLPEFEITMDNGSGFSSTELYGNISVITFFTTKCSDCRATLPEVEKAYKSFSDKGVTFICISREETEEAVRNMWSTFGLTMPRSTQSDRKIYGLFATSQVPRIYISDKNCKVRFIHTDNPLPDSKVLGAELDELLR